MIGGQHGEDRILEMFFKGQETGFIIDVGAADGIDNSNSYKLLQRPGWGGLLIEPEPSQYAAMFGLYEGRKNIHTFNNAVGLQGGITATLFQGGQISTLCPHIKQSGIDVHGEEVYKGEIQVTVHTLTSLIKSINDFFEIPTIDFLTIDAEGMDFEVWRSLDKKEWMPRLVCMEGHGYMMEGYYEFCRVGGNTFYVRMDEYT